MGARVLVVDDSPTIRKLVSAILERHQYEPTTAADGQAGLDRLREGNIDLVLLDFVMPRMNGYQFCREMRADEKLNHLPVVLMSAKGDKIRGQFVQQTGALDAITKPFDARGLIAVVESALQKVADGRVRQMDSIPIDEEELTEIEIDPDPDDDDAENASGEDDLPGFSGNLGVIPLAEVLQMLQLGRQTGTITVSNGKVEVTVSLRDGLVDLARGKGAAEEFRLGRYLIEEGLVTRDELNTILKNRVSGRKLLGEALINYGLISEEDLRRALIRQTSELIYDVLRWPKGRFSFSKDDHRSARSREARTPGGVDRHGGLPAGRRVAAHRRLDPVRRGPPARPGGARRDGSRKAEPPGAAHPGDHRRPTDGARDPGDGRRRLVRRLQDPLPVSPIAPGPTAGRLAPEELAAGRRKQ